MKIWRDLDLDKKKTKLEIVLFGEESNIISKIYKILLERYTAEEAVKEQMIKWAINSNVEIMVDQWEYLWMKEIKISTCTTFQENCFKMKYL